MASHPVVPATQSVDGMSEKQLTREEWWALMNSLMGSAGDIYAKEGGAEAFLRAERAAWGEEDSLR